MKELNTTDNKILFYMNTQKEYLDCTKISEGIEEEYNDVYHHLKKLEKKDFIIRQQPREQGFHDKAWVFYLLDFEKYDRYLEEQSEIKNIEDVPKNERKELANMILDIIRQRIIDSPADFREFKDGVDEGLKEKEQEDRFIERIDKSFFPGIIKEKSQKIKPINPFKEAVTRKQQAEYERFTWEIIK